jgi:hypothetical protein
MVVVLPRRCLLLCEFEPKKLNFWPWAEEPPCLPGPNGALNRDVLASFGIMITVFYPGLELAFVVSITLFEYWVVSIWLFLYPPTELFAKSV